MKFKSFSDFLYKTVFKDKGKLSLFLCFSLTYGFLQAIYPKYVGATIEKLSAFLMQKQESSYAVLIQHILILALILGSLAIMSGLIIYIYENTMVRRTADLRIQLFQKILNLDVFQHESRRDGELLNYLTTDINNINTALHEALTRSVNSCFSILIILGVTATIDPYMSLIFVISLVSIGFITKIVNKKARKHIIQQQEMMGDINGFVNEHISGQKLIIAMGLQEEISEQFLKKNQAIEDVDYKAKIYSNLLGPLINGIRFFVTSFIIVISMIRAYQKGLHLEAAIAYILMFAQYAMTLFFQVRVFFSLFPYSLRGYHSLKRVYGLLQHAEEQESKNTVPIEPLKNEIVFNKVSFSYPMVNKNTKSDAVKEVSFKIKKGDIVALIGETGAGKSTIIALLNRFYSVDSGYILYDDKNINNFKLNEYRAQIAIVPQDPILFSATIAENIAFGNVQATQEEIETVAKKAFIHDYILTLKDGYETKITDENSFFSDGQKQLICIARALLKPASLYVLDEATSNVDTVTEQQVQKAIDLVLDKTTSLVIAHRLQTILRADHILVLSEGKLVESGNHQTLYAKQGYYYSLYQKQFSNPNTLSQD